MKRAEAKLFHLISASAKPHFQLLIRPLPNYEAQACTVRWCTVSPELAHALDLDRVQGLTTAVPQ